MALEEQALMEAPKRNREEPNRVVGVVQRGQLVVNAREIRGVDYGYYEVVMVDGGVGYLRAQGDKLHVYVVE